MIAVRIDPRCSEIMRQLPITEAEVLTTVNERHCGLVDDGLTRIAAVHWFNEDRIVMIESAVTKRRLEGDRMHFDEVCVLLAIVLGRSLPAGFVTRDMEMWQIQEAVARSFGCPFRFHPSQPYVTLYASGPWDGGPPLFKPDEYTGEVLVLASLDPVQHSAKRVWTFNLNRYLLWLSQQP